jgi:peptide subunit release factor 1 (eRF1)
MNNKKAKKETSEGTKKGFSTFIGKISGKGELEFEVERLNSQIIKLERDLQSAKIQLEKREGLARQAVADRQEVEAFLNQERIRTQTLSHEIETIRTESENKLKFRGIETLSPQAVQAYISKLKSFQAPADDLLTVYLPPNTRLSKVLNEKLIEKIEAKILTLLERLDPETGLILFYDIHRMVCEAIVPPVPIASPAWHLDHSFDVFLLEESLSKDYHMLVLVLHAGESFIGFTANGRLFDTEELIRSSVKEKHSKGGFSQRRFERLREEDIAHHMDKVIEVLDKVLEENKFIDYVILNGDFQLIGEVRKRLPFNLEIIEKSSDIKIEKAGSDEILRSVLSSRRYLL